MSKPFCSINALLLAALFPAVLSCAGCGHNANRSGWLKLPPLSVANSYSTDYPMYMEVVRERNAEGATFFSVRLTVIANTITRKDAGRLEFNVNGELISLTPDSVFGGSPKISDSLEIWYRIEQMNLQRIASGRVVFVQFWMGQRLILRKLSAENIGQLRAFLYGFDGPTRELENPSTSFEISLLQFDVSISNAILLSQVLLHRGRWHPETVDDFPSARGIPIRGRRPNTRVNLTPAISAPPTSFVPTSRCRLRARR